MTWLPVCALGIAGSPIPRIGCRQPFTSLGIAMLASPLDWLRVAMVRTVGIEPTLPIGKRILSPQRLPFRHVRSATSATVVPAGPIPR